MIIKIIFYYGKAKGFIQKPQKLSGFYRYYFYLANTAITVIDWWGYQPSALICDINFFNISSDLSLSTWQVPAAG